MTIQARLRIGVSRVLRLTRDPAHSAPTLEPGVSEEFGHQGGADGTGALAQ